MSNESSEVKRLADGWMCYEVVGIEITKDGKTPLVNKEDIQVGDKITFPGIRSEMEMTVTKDKYGVLSANNGRWATTLQFAEDSRKCWVSIGMFNLNAVKILTKEVNG